MSLNIRITEHPDGGRSIEIGDAPASPKISPLLFGPAPRYHVGGMTGLASDEVPAILHRGQDVPTRESLRKPRPAAMSADAQNLSDGIAVATLTQPRFIKLGGAGEPLAEDASSWAAVQDKTTGLIWSAENVAPKRLPHAKAVAVCQKLELAGAKDWQLPTRTQLLTLVDDTRHEPAIDTDYFPKTENGYYWTNTPCAWRPGSAAWCVDFLNGRVHDFGHGAECFVRAVRVASPAASQ
jgi:hypothetical protein